MDLRLHRLNRWVTWIRSIIKPDHRPLHISSDGVFSSTAEKARDSAHRCLDLAPPYTEQAWSCLVTMLDQQKRCLELIDIVASGAERERARALNGVKETNPCDDAFYWETLLALSGELMIGQYLSLPRLSGREPGEEPGKEPRLIVLEKIMQSFIAEGEVAIGHCEMVLINVACDDPGATLGIQVILPILQQRIDMRIALSQMEKAERLVAQLIREEEAEKRLKAANEEKTKAKKKEGKKKKAQATKAHSSSDELDEPKVESKPGVPSAPADEAVVVVEEPVTTNGGGKECTDLESSAVEKKEWFLDEVDDRSKHDEGWIEVDNTQKPKSKIPSVRSMTDASKAAQTSAAVPAVPPAPPMRKPASKSNPSLPASPILPQTNSTDSPASAPPPPPRLHKPSQATPDAISPEAKALQPGTGGLYSTPPAFHTHPLPLSLDARAIHAEHLFGAPLHHHDSGLHMRLSDLHLSPGENAGEVSGPNFHFSLPSSLLDDLGPRWGDEPAPHSSHNPVSSDLPPTSHPLLLCCPITGSLMDDPVVAMDGFFYERQAISQWMMSGRLVSPVNATPLPSGDLITALPIRKAISEYRDSLAIMRS